MSSYGSYRCPQVHLFTYDSCCYSITQGIIVVQYQRKDYMLIVLEGVDGAGKSTLARMLADTLKFSYRHYPVNIERAKGYYPDEPIDVAMAIDMVHHIPDPALNWVLDRYYYSHYAYGGRFTAFLKKHLPAPDFYFLLDVDPLESFLRCQNRGDDTDITVERRVEIRRRYLEGEWSAIIPQNFSTLQAYRHIVTHIQAA